MSSKTDKKKAMVPKLRFPEFRDAGPWEVKRLGEVAQFLKGKNISKEDIAEDGATPCVRYGELYTHYGEKIDNTISSTNLDPDDLVISKANDVIIPASGETEEDIATASCILNDGIAVGGDINIIRSCVNGVFLSYYLNSAKRMQIARLAQGVSVIHLYPNQLQKLKAAIPAASEQQKIADCLSSIDELIELEAKRLEALKAHKKGLMQQLFPQEGETVPRLRFPEFRDAGPWEVKRLGEVFQERNERNGSGLELLSVTLYDGVVKASQLERKNNASSDLSNYKRVYPNDIVYNSMRMWQGASGVSKWHGIVSPAYTVVRPLENHNSLFWAYHFKLSGSIEKFACYSQGVTSDTWNLKFPAFAVIKMAFPSLPEQQKIADCLSSIDELIELEAKRLEALKAHKKGLMQQLFPQEVG